MANHISLRDTYETTIDHNGHSNDIGFGLKKLTSGGVLRFLQYVSNHFYDRSVQVIILLPNSYTHQLPNSLSLSFLL